MEQTICIIKPEFTHLKDAINGTIEKAGLRVVASKQVQFSKAQAGMFYQDKKEREFFEPLTQYISSGPAIVQIIEGPDAIARYDALVGTSPFPQKAGIGSLRQRYGIDDYRNVVHGSADQPEAQQEATLLRRFFGLSPAPAMLQTEDPEWNALNQLSTAQKETMLAQLSAALGQECTLLSPPEKLVGGFSRHIYKFATDHGSFVFSLFHGRQALDAKAVVAVEQALGKQGAAVATPIGDGTVSGDAGHAFFFSIAPFCDVACVTDPTAVQVEALGTELAQIHLLGQTGNRSQQNTSAGWEIEIGQLLNGGQKHLQQTGGLGTNPAASRHILSYMESVIRTRFAGASLPSGMNHGNLGSENVLFTKDRPLFLDWEEAKPRAYVFDIAEMLTSFFIRNPLYAGLEIREEGIENFLHSYQQKRPLTQQEVEMLPDAIRIAALVRAEQIYRKEPDEKDAAHIINKVDTWLEYTDFYRMLGVDKASPPVTKKNHGRH